MIKFGVILPVRYGWPYVQASVESLFAPAASEQIAASLANCAPAAAGFLRSPPKVAAIAALNATPLRRTVPQLRRAYHRFWMQAQ